MHRAVAWRRVDLAAQPGPPSAREARWGRAAPPRLGLRVQKAVPWYSLRCWVHRAVRVSPHRGGFGDPLRYLFAKCLPCIFLLGAFLGWGGPTGHFTHPRCSWRGLLSHACPPAPMHQAWTRSGEATLVPHSRPPTCWSSWSRGWPWGHPQGLALANGHGRQGVLGAPGRGREHTPNTWH